MFWLPVIFLCATGGECGFVFDKVQESRGQCMASLQRMEKALPKENFPTFRAGCLDIEIKGGKNVSLTAIP